jgi:hypothetical protein
MRPEQAIQRAIVQHWQVRKAPGAFMFAVPNGGYRSKIEAAIMRSTGTVAGIPDLCIIHEGKSYFLELKAPGGRPTVKQLECIEALNLAGAYCCVAEGLDRALACLEGWGLLRGRAA